MHAQWIPLTDMHERVFPVASELIPPRPAPMLFPHHTASQFLSIQASTYSNTLALLILAGLGSRRAPTQVSGIPA
jgi:hypothetical protein